MNANDINRLLKLFVEEPYILVINDSESRIHEAEKLTRSKEFEGPIKRVLVNCDRKYYEHEDLSSYDIIIDIGSSITVDGYNTRAFEYVQRKGGSLKWLFPIGKLHYVRHLLNLNNERCSNIQSGLMRLTCFLGLNFLYVKSKLSIHFKYELRIEDTLSVIDFDDYAIRFGHLRSKRRVTMVVLKEEQPVNYVKIALNKEDKMLFENEKMALEHGCARSLFSAVTTQMVEVESSTVFVSKPIGRDGDVPAEITDFHLRFLNEMYSSSKREGVLKEMDYWRNIKSNLKIIELSELFGKRRQIIDALNYIVEGTDENKWVVTMACHGDFQLMNTRNVFSEMAVLNWEYYKFSAPMLYDLIHLLISKHAFRGGVEAFRRELDILVQGSILGGVLSKYYLNLDYVVQHYLLKHISYSIALESRSSDNRIDNRLIQFWSKLLQDLLPDFVSNSRKENVLRNIFRLAGEKFEYVCANRYGKSLEEYLNSQKLEVLICSRDIDQFVQLFSENFYVRSSKLVSKGRCQILRIFLHNSDSVLIVIRTESFFKNIDADLSQMLRSRENLDGIYSLDFTRQFEFAFLKAKTRAKGIPEKYGSYFLQSNYGRREKALRYLSQKYALRVDIPSSLFSEEGESVKLKDRKAFPWQAMLFLRQLMTRDLDQGFSLVCSGPSAELENLKSQDLINELRKEYLREVVLLDSKDMEFSTLLGWFVIQCRIYFLHVLSGKIVVQNTHIYDVLDVPNSYLGKACVKLTLFFADVLNVMPKYSVIVMSKKSFIGRAGIGLEKSVREKYLKFYALASKSGSVPRYGILDDLHSIKGKSEFISGIQRAA